MNALVLTALVGAANAVPQSAAAGKVEVKFFAEAVRAACALLSRACMAYSTKASPFV